MSRETDYTRPQLSRGGHRSCGMGNEDVPQHAAGCPDEHFDREPYCAACGDDGFIADDDAENASRSRPCPCGGKGAR